MSPSSSGPNSQARAEPENTHTLEEHTECIRRCLHSGEASSPISRMSWYPVARRGPRCPRAPWPSCDNGMSIASGLEQRVFPPSEPLVTFDSLFPALQEQHLYCSSDTASWSRPGTYATYFHRHPYYRRRSFLCSAIFSKRCSISHKGFCQQPFPRTI